MILLMITVFWFLDDDDDIADIFKDDLLILGDDVDDVDDNNLLFLDDDFPFLNDDDNGDIILKGIVHNLFSIVQISYFG